MSRHARAIEALVAFAVELAALAAVVRWGLGLEGRLARVGATVLLPLGVATAWAIFRVPGDGGRPRVVVSGRTRLVLEGAVLTGATAALLAAGLHAWALAWAVLLTLRLVTGRERFRRLLARTS